MRSWREWMEEDRQQEHLKRVFGAIQVDQKKYKIYPAFPIVKEIIFYDALVEKRISRK